MKSKTSCFNKTIFLKNITHFWPIWIMITAWNLFIMPFMIFNSSQQYKYMTGYTKAEMAQLKINDMLSIVSIYTNPALLFIFSVIAVMAVFSFLYNSRAANAMHAFPVTRKELFLTNYVSGLLFLIVPEIIGFLAGTLVGAVCGYSSMNHLLTGLLFACGISFVFYSLTVWVAMFTGQLLAVPVFAFVLNFLYVGCKFLVHSLMSLISYGIPLDFHGSRMDALSPLYYLSGHVYLKYDYSEKYTVCTGLAGSKIVGIYVLISILFVIAAYLLYRIRNMETAGNLISISYIAPVFRWGVAFCGGGALSVMFCAILDFSSSGAKFMSAILSAAAFGAIGFFAAQMFLEKGFRVFQKKRLIECGVLLVIVVCMYAGIEADVFGVERKMPEQSEIEKAYVDGYVPVGGSDADMIAEILDIHSQIIDSKREFEKFVAENQEIYYVNIKYRMKNGSVLERRYQVPWKEEMAEENGTVMYKIMEFTTQPRAFRRELFGIIDQDIDITLAQIDVYGENRERTDHTFTEEETEKIYQAILKDIDEGNFKKVLKDRYFYERRNESTYYNTIKLEFAGKEKIISPYSDFYSREEAVKSGEANIEFDADCKNIIAALLDTGVIESEQNLVTINEWNGEDFED